MEFINAVRDGFKNYANTKTTASRSQLYYWCSFAVISLIFSTLLDIFIFDYNAYSQLLELNKPTGWISRIWLLSNRGLMKEDPLIFCLKDIFSLITISFIFLIFIFAK